MDMRKGLGGKYLKGIDFQVYFDEHGEDHQFEIRRVVMEKVGDDTKTCMYFDEFDTRPLPLNAGNLEKSILMFGHDSLTYKGKKVGVKLEPGNYNGNDFIGVRFQEALGDAPF